MSEHSPILTRPLNGGTQYLYRFPNGYGASLIVGGFAAYGGRELAVIRYDGDGVDDYGLTYDTPITDDVLGHLSDDEVGPILDSIAALPNPAEVQA